MGPGVRQRLRYVLLASLLPLGFGGVRAATDVPVDKTPVPVYVFAGQSNMVGANASARTLGRVAPDLVRARRNVLFYGPDDMSAFRWTNLGPRTELTQTAYGPGFGPELAAGAALGKKHTLVAIVKFARCGTNLYRDWDPNRPDGLYAHMVSRVRVAIDELELRTRRIARVAGFFWMQGEGDSYRYGDAIRYERRLTRLIARVRTDVGDRSTPVVLGKVNSYAGQYAEIIRGAQAAVASRIWNTHAVDTEDLAHDPASLVHLNTRGEVDLGYRFANALAPEDRSEHGLRR